MVIPELLDNVAIGLAVALLIGVAAGLLLRHDLVRRPIRRLAGVAGRIADWRRSRTPEIAGRARRAALVGAVWVDRRIFESLQIAIARTFEYLSLALRGASTGQTHHYAIVLLAGLVALVLVVCWAALVTTAGRLFGGSG